MQSFLLSRFFQRLSVCGIVLSVLITSFVQAADFKPYLTLKIDSPSAIISIVEKYSSLIPKVPGMPDLKTVLAPYKKLPGVNAAGTFNLALQRNENSTSGVDLILFLPITNVEQFNVPGQETYIGMIKAMIKKEGDRYMIASPIGEFIGYQKKGYLAIAPLSVAEFAAAADPKDIFGDLDQFTFGFTANLENLTADDVDTILGTLAPLLAMQGGEAATNNWEGMAAAIQKAHAEMLRCTWGLTLDERTMDVTASSSIVPRSGTQTAEKIQKTKAAKTKFGGVLHDHARTIFSWSYTDYFTDSEITEANNGLQLIGGSFMEGLNEGAEDEETPLARLAEIVFAWLQEQVNYYAENRSVDIAVSLDAEGTFLYAESMTQPELTTKIGTDLYNALPELLGDEQGSAFQQLLDSKIKQDYEKAADFSLSSLSDPFTDAPAELPIPPMLKALPINVIWAVKSGEAVVIAAGLDFAKTERAIKAALGKTTASVTPKQTAVIALKPLGDLLQKHLLPLAVQFRVPSGDIEKARVLLPLLAGSESSAKITFTTEYAGDAQVKKMHVGGRCLNTVVKIMMKEAEFTAMRSAMEIMQRQQAENAAQQQEVEQKEQAPTQTSDGTPPPVQDEAAEMQNPFSE